jgi:hypothetical protein
MICCQGNESVNKPVNKKEKGRNFENRPNPQKRNNEIVRWMKKCHNELETK